MAENPINICDIVQDSINWCEGTPEFAGIQMKVLYTAASNILKWPERETTATGRELAAYKDKSSFELKADKKWYSIDILAAKSKASSDPQGEFPSGSQLNKLELIHPGTGEKACNAAAYINNVPCVFLVQDMSGNWRVVGCKRWQSEIKNTLAVDLGQGSAGTAQSTLTIEAPDTTPLPIYKGDIYEGEIAA